MRYANHFGTLVTPPSKQKTAPTTTHTDNTAIIMNKVIMTSPYC